MTTARWTFGRPAPAELGPFAERVRRLVDLALSIETPGPTLEDAGHRLDEAIAVLEPLAAADTRPRVGPAATDDQRPYLDHSRFIGDYQPFFPAYSFDVEDGIGRGTVTFPIAFEGPPGCAHGGFVALLFDCVFQHLNSDLGSTGKTANLQISFKRPTPILTELTIETRQAGLDGRKLTTTGELRLGDDVVAEAETLAIVRPREDMPETP